MSLQSPFAFSIIRFMKLNSLKKYIFGNILSIDGYLMLLYAIYFWFYVRPKYEARSAEIIAK